MNDPAKLVRDFSTGAVTDYELVVRLCQAAIEQPPELIAAALPNDILMAMKDASSDPDGGHGSLSIVFIDGIQVEGKFAPHELTEEERRFVEGRLRWHAYFASRSGRG